MWKYSITVTILTLNLILKVILTRKFDRGLRVKTVSF